MATITEPLFSIGDFPYAIVPQQQVEACLDTIESAR
ncbi:hypothetical protein BCUN_0901 [Bifidobacterium cuniculi]|uniref:Uncharacterized protein n=1 Tax=Bifidobacterium cuniculi TaxID=1688 RepID=A0A087AQ75_9BIFI|nr:hypothetical protein BCUN_0901 [Bifidobacterium cuniculi]